MGEIQTFWDPLPRSWDSVRTDACPIDFDRFLFSSTALDYSVIHETSGRRDTPITYYFRSNHKVVFKYWLSWKCVYTIKQSSHADISLNSLS